MTESSQQAEVQAGAPFRVRDGLWIAGGVAVLVAAVAVVLLVMGVWRRLARTVVPGLLDVPGGSWAVGGALGLVSVLGCAGGVRLWACGAGPVSGVRRVARAVAGGVCWAAVVGPAMLLFAGLGGRNCRSSRASCTYIPGTGTALLAYVACAAVVGLLGYRWRQAVVEERRLRERERIRKVRKKGKGKSRAARPLG